MRAREGPAAIGVALGLVALVVGIYAGTTSHPFVALDDDVYLLGNPHIARGLTGASLVWAFTHAYAGNWHPLTWISHMIDVQLFGLSEAAAGFHHGVSAALHAANAVLLFIALRRMTGRLAPSAWVAALFAVHPLRVESVAWASERKDVLSGLGFVFALLAYAYYVQRPSTRRMMAVLVAQVAGLMAKPTLVMLPLLLMILDRWPLDRWKPERARALVLEKAPLFAASVVLGAVTIATQRAEGAVAPLTVIPWGARLANAAIAIASYLGKGLWPSRLACFYPHPSTLAPSRSWPLMVSAATLLIAAVSWLAVRERTRRPYLLAGWLWFLILLLPVIGLVQVGNQAWADRYAYLPLIGPSLAIVWGVADTAARAPVWRRSAAIGGTAIVLGFAALAQRQTRVWASTDALYRHALAVTRENWFAENALGVEAMQQGRSDEALHHFEQSLNDLAPRLRDGYREVHTNLGLLFLQQGRYDDARRELEHVLSVAPDFPEAHNDLALLFLRTQRLDDARRHAERAVAERPDYVDAHFNLALALQAQGHLEDAAKHFERVVSLQPADAEAHAQLGRLLAALSRRDEARAELAEAVRLAPDHPWARQALAELERPTP